MPFLDGSPLTCTPNLIYVSAGKCRGPKSLNGIKLSHFIQVLLHFSDLRSLALAVVGVGVGVS